MRALRLDWLRRRLPRRLLTLSTPLVLQTGLMMAVNQVDRLMIGQLGEVAVAGVGLAGQLLFAGAVLFGVLAAGCGILVSQYHGAREHERLKELLVASLWLGELVGLVLFLPAVLAAPTLLGWLGAEPEVARVGGRYLTIEACSLPLYLAATLCIGSLVAMGHTRVALWAGGLTMAVKLLLGWALIFGVGPVPALGVVGAAVSGLVAQSLEGVLALAVLLNARLARAEGRPVLTLRELARPRLEPLARLMPLVLPMLADNLVWQGASVGYSALAASEGTLALASWQILITVRSLGYLPVSGLPQAVEATVGQALGRGRFRRAWAGAGDSLRLALAVALLSCVLLWGAAPWVVSLYQVAPEALHTATLAVVLMAAVQPFENLNTVMPTLLRLGGQPWPVMVTGASTFLVVGLGGGYLLGQVLGLGLAGVLGAMVAESVLKSLLFYRLYRRGHWVRRLV